MGYCLIWTFLSYSYVRTCFYMKLWMCSSGFLCQGENDVPAPSIHNNYCNCYYQDSPRWIPSEKSNYKIHRNFLPFRIVRTLCSIGIEMKSFWCRSFQIPVDPYSIWFFVLLVDPCSSRSFIVPVDHFLLQSILPCSSRSFIVSVDLSCSSQSGKEMHVYINLYIILMQYVSCCCCCCLSSL